MKLENFYFFIARRFPFKKLQYFLANDLVAKATTGEYSNTIVPELTALDALKRFGKDYKIL